MTQEREHTHRRLPICKWDKGKWRFDKVPYTFHKHRRSAHTDTAKQH